jgi:hypothetical protein
VVNVLEMPSSELKTAAPPPQQHDVTLKIDADLLQWLAKRGEEAVQEINGLLRFYTGRCQCVMLVLGVLVLARDAGIADVGHGWNYARGLLRDPALFGSRAYGRGLDRAKGVRCAR